MLGWSTFKVLSELTASPHDSSMLARLRRRTENPDAGGRPTQVFLSFVLLAVPAASFGSEFNGAVGGPQQTVGGEHDDSFDALCRRPVVAN